MRFVVLALCLLGCRQSLGIPSGGSTDEPGFLIRVEVEGATGASGGASVTLARSGDEEVIVEPLSDDTTVLSTALLDGEEFEITANTGNCTIAGGSGRIEAGDATGPRITCDGLAALDSFGFSAPITFEPAFDGSIDSPRPLVSIIVQQTGWSPSARHPAAAMTNLAFEGGVPSGPFPIEPGRAWTLDIANASFDRSYSADPMITAPSAFGYGKPSIVEDSARFGSALAMAGNDLVVSSQNAATIFERDGAGWTEVARLTGADQFGAAVAIAGDKLAIASPAARKVTIYTRANATWGNPIELTNPEATDAFGTSIAIESPTTILVGDPECRLSGCVFRFVNGTASVVDHGKPGDRFGASMAVSSTRLVVGAPGDDSGSNDPDAVPPLPDAGAAYAFALPNLASFEYLKASSPNSNDRFGSSVAIETTNGMAFIVVGAPLEDSADDTDPDDNSKTGAGAAFVFQLDQNVWELRRMIKAPNADTGDNFGAAVGIRSSRVGIETPTCVIAIAAPFEDSGIAGVLDDESATDAGALYVYRIDTAGVLGSPVYGKASKIGSLDALGTTLAITEEAVVAGAPTEDSSRPGWNQAADEGARDSGAVFTFR